MTAAKPRAIRSVFAQIFQFGRMQLGRLRGPGRPRFKPDIPGSPTFHLHGFWPGADDDEGLFEVFFDLLASGTKTHKRICLASVFAPPPKIRKSDTLYVQFSAESYFHDPDLFDINLIAAPPGPKIIPLPYMSFEYWRRHHLQPLCRNRDISHTDFSSRRSCLFVVSNPKCEQRLDFFKQLSAVMPVDSWGSVQNNQEGERPIGNWWDKSYLDLIRKYRFMICFENCSKDFYLTEKLLNAYAGGAIPIYWGCPQANEMLNEGAFFFIHSQYAPDNVSNLISQILAANNDYDRFRKIFAQPLFADNTESRRFSQASTIDQIEQLRIASIKSLPQPKP